MVFRRKSTELRCTLCGAVRTRRKNNALWCKNCDDHAASCPTIAHYPGKCPQQPTDRTPPAGLWVHSFRKGDIPDAEFVVPPPQE